MTLRNEDDVTEQTPWELRQLEELVGARYEGMTRTILLAGGVKHADAVQDRIGVRILSFLRERGASIEARGLGFRVSSGAEASVVVPL